MTRLVAFLEWLESVSCRIGWHAWDGALPDQRVCEVCGCGEVLRETSVTVQWHRWERVS